MGLTKFDFFNALHVSANLGERIRYNGKLISTIIIDEYDPETHAADISMAMEGGVIVSEDFYKTYFKDSVVKISTVPARKRIPNRKEDWIEITSKELDQLYQQVLAKVGSVDENDLGEWKKLY
jgi:hypothetical protein